jgi:hypothetical protein
VKVLTQHNDNFRSGAQSEEAHLNWQNVNVGSFGKVCEHAVEGLIYAQPLYVPSVSVAHRSVVNLVVVATMENWVYAFDADDDTGGANARVWAHRLGVFPPVPSGAFRPGYGDIGGTAHRSNIGILSTPVIDVWLSSDSHFNIGTIYLVAMTWDPVTFDNSPETAFRHLLFALDLSTGLPKKLTGGRPNPVEFSGFVPGSGYGANNRVGPARRVNGKIVFDGKIAKDRLAAETPGPHASRAWPITDGTTGDRPEQVVFNSMQQLQRPGLLLLNGVIYTAFGSHGDHDPYHGWIFAHEAETLRMQGIFCTTCNGAQGGIWQAGEGLGADAEGHVFAGTGNGDSDATGGAFGESLLKIELNAAGLELLGFSQAFRDPKGGDEDFGASSPTFLPDGFMAGGGKDGHFYLFNPLKMDKNGSPASLVQLFLASADQKSDSSKTHHIHGSPVVFDNGTDKFMYVWGENDRLRCLRYDPATHLFPGQPNGRNRLGTAIAIGDTTASADVPPPGGMPGGMLSVSSKGSSAGTGIVWASFPPYRDANKGPVRGELRAYKADEFHDGRLVTLWSSRCNRRRDDYGTFAKFCCPTIAAGRVYQATFNEPGSLAVYGILKTQNGGYNLGFGGTTGLVFNGSACVEQTHVRLVESPHLFQAGSIFSRHKVEVTAWETIFTFQLPFSEADGFAFIIQNRSPYALGGAGMGLGYGIDPISPFDRGAKIGTSVAIRFGLIGSLVGTYSDGDTPTGGPTERPAGLNLQSGHAVRATLSFTAGVISLNLKDLVTNDQSSHSFSIDLLSHTGRSAYIGFSGASGAKTSTQDILSWSFRSL